MGDAGSDVKNAIVAAKHIQTKSLMASVVPAKRATHEFPAKRVRAFLKEMGLEHGDVVIKSDQEPSIQDLVQEIIRARAPAKTIPEQAPVKSSSSNGHAERGIQSIEGHVRVMKDSLETKIGVSVPSNHDIVSWMVVLCGVAEQV